MCSLLNLQLLNYMVEDAKGTFYRRLCRTNSSINIETKRMTTLISAIKKNVCDGFCYYTYGEPELSESCCWLTLSFQYAAFQQFTILDSGLSSFLYVLRDTSQLYLYMSLLIHLNMGLVRLSTFWRCIEMLQKFKKHDK